MPDRTVIVTGCSGGIGAATAAALEARDWHVFATRRRTCLSNENPNQLALDVTSDESVMACVAEVMRRTGRIDAIVNNAGVDLVGAVEETSLDEARALFDANFFGVHRLVRTVLPIMREQAAGRIVTIGSMSGFLPAPFSAFYSASKHALEGYHDTLAFEVEPFGIRCSLVQPGFVKTDFAAKMSDAKVKIDAYARRRARATELLTKGAYDGIDSEIVAERIAMILEYTDPRSRYRVGRDAITLAAARQMIPDRFFRMGLRRWFAVRRR